MFFKKQINCSLCEDNNFEKAKKGRKQEGFTASICFLATFDIVLFIISIVFIIQHLII